LAAGSVSVTGNATLRPTVNNLSLTNNLAIGDGIRLTVDTPTNLFTLGGVISGNGGIIKTGSGTLSLSGNNTYGGGTAINGGIVAVSNLADGGSASNLGQSSNAAGNLIIDGGILQYVGSGSLSDRLFTVGAAGAIIE